MGHTQGLIFPLQLFTIVIMGSLAVVAWRYRSRPGARPFAAMMGSIGVLAAAPPLQLAVSDSLPLASFVLTATTDSAGNVAVLAWLLFVLEYTGSRFVTRRTVAALSVLPVFMVVVLWTPPLRSLVRGSPLASILPLYLLAYTLTGIVLLLRFVVSERRLYTDQSVALIVGVSAPVVGGISEAHDLLRTDVNLLMSSFVVTGLAFAFALFRFELFDVLPITRRIGRNNAIEDFNEGLFIVDPNEQVVDVNRAAAAIADRSPSALIGEPFGTILGERVPDDALAPETFKTDAGRIYDVSVAPIRDPQDRTVSHTVLFKDVTDRELRETQLGVLNRVLRHNLRNKLTAVHGRAEAIVDRVDDEHVEHLERQMTATSELLALGERAREFERLESREEAAVHRVDAAEKVEMLVDDLRTEFPGAEVTVEVPGNLALETYPKPLEIVLSNLLDNAARHSDRETPEIEVTIATEDGDVEFQIRDDGPGIPDHELSVLDAEAESALEHGSGLGLWIAKWGVRHLGGDLVFEDRDPRGTTATVTVPRTVASNGDGPNDPPTPE